MGDCQIRTNQKEKNRRGEIEIIVPHGSRGTGRKEKRITYRNY